ncbi:MAG: galactokinase [Acidimicrobiales bacterium]|jgi:galactokinase|nr:galactokinase [Acidimicrobiales bacterium]MDP6298814.1 galactokinase [Acidimicrobiales bacterium]HJM29282.1 galactokinase [Acidimicrobiales bacterium]HJM97213.1 galactokinase [Acidimicrobiales bacterium]
MYESDALISKAQKEFRTYFKEEPAFVVRCPGRVNLIGEHTDYNDGFVLPIALPFSTVIAASPSSSDLVSAHSEGFGPAQFSLSEAPQKSVGWSRYLHGMGAFLRRSGIAVRGWNGYICSDIPAGANLSSSAALEMAAGMTFKTIAEADIPLMEIAAIGKAVENELMGVRSGIMDQLACAFAEAGSALLIDCQSLNLTLVELPKSVSVVVMDTGTRRDLSETAYNDRRETCERVSASLGAASLRELSLEDLASLGSVDEIGLRRARHVITENQRVLDLVKCLEGNALELTGEILNASHESLRNDYEVSGPALDKIVEIAQNVTGCYGARMTGGGFAGSAIALVDTSHVERFCEEVSDSFEVPAGQPAEAPTELYAVEASAGISVL